MTKVFCLDDHRLFVAGLRVLLEQEPDLTLVGEAYEAPNAIEAIASTGPDVLMIDVALRGADGVEFTRTILEHHPRLRVLIVSAYSAPELVVEAFEAGALGYAHKEQPPEELFEAVRTVASGQPYLATSFPRSLLETRRSIGRGKAGNGTLASLSQREREVFDLLIRGYTNDAVAEAFGISIKTVQTHRAKINDKLDLHSSSNLLRFAARRGCLQE